MPARIPEIEVTDHADPPCIGSEYNESHPIDPVERHWVRTELVVEPLMGAFAEQIEIEIAQHRREAVGVLEFDDVVAEAGAPPGIAGSRSAARQRTIPHRESAPVKQSRRARQRPRRWRLPAGTRARWSGRP